MSASVKPPAALKKRVLSAKQRQQPNTLLGLRGEKIAINLLQQAGYQIVATNYCFQGFEVDVIAFDVSHQELVFCEVKTRSSDTFGHPTQAMTWKKYRSMIKIATLYCAQYHYSADFRFDMISVLPSSIQHYKNISFG